MKRSKSPAHSPEPKLPSQFRIIGGTWRSRKFHFPPTPGLRPTPDRVRETVFNWLSAHIKDARCLDLFCGSGALGLESLSRGASHCTFIDAEPQVTSAIQQHLQTLQCRNGMAITSPLPTALLRLTEPYDIIFLDPPYAIDCITTCLEQVVSKHLLNPGALIYIECDSKRPLPALPPGLSMHRHKIAGQVQYALLHYSARTSMCPADPL